MLTPYTQSPQVAITSLRGGKFIEKFYTDPSGQQFKLVLFVALIDGEVKAKLIRAECVSQGFKMLDSGFKNGGNLFCLPGPAAFRSIPASCVLHPESYAPFVNELFFFTSQPTRAPSL